MVLTKLLQKWAIIKYFPVEGLQTYFFGRGISDRRFPNPVTFSCFTWTILNTAIAEGAFDSLIFAGALDYFPGLLGQ